MAETLLRGKDYVGSCPACVAAIDTAADEIEARREMGEESMISGRVSLDLIDDNEAASMLAYDRGQTCSSKGGDCPVEDEEDD